MLLDRTVLLVNDRPASHSIADVADSIPIQPMMADCSISTGDLIRELTNALRFMPVSSSPSDGPNSLSRCARGHHSRLLPTGYVGQFLSESNFQLSMRALIRTIRNGSRSLSGTISILYVPPKLKMLPFLVE